MPEPSDRKAHIHPFKRKSANDAVETSSVPRPGIQYAELAITSNFTFLTGASHPDELVLEAAARSYHALAITDHNSLAGIVRAHVAAKDYGVQFIVGCRLSFTDLPWLSLLVYPTNRVSYGRLCRLLTLGKRRAPKGQCHLSINDLVSYCDGLLGILQFLPSHKKDSNISIMNAVVAKLLPLFAEDRLSIALSRLHEAQDEENISTSIELSQTAGVPIVAVNDVYYHVPERKPLQDVLTCIRYGCTLNDAGFRLFPNSERHLKSPDEMARLFAEYPQAISRTIEVAERAKSFSLDQLRYEYPHEICPHGRTLMEHLRDLTWYGAKKHYGESIPKKVRFQIEYEFKLIEELQYAPYFLTVYDLVRFARSKGILCQGRGAAANSAVCFCLGITSVDPGRIDVLFERFVSRERNEPPDIDIDFEHERREEVIQYIYEKYGRERAGLAAEVVTYRARSAIRDVGKALGLSLDAVDQMAKRMSHWLHDGITQEHLAEAGFGSIDQTLWLLLRLTHEIAGFPRHLSQHVGGFVIARDALCELVPIENAAMDGRTVIEWDKDDIDALGMLKIDVLALGMLTCVSKALELIKKHHSCDLTFSKIPSEDPAVYEMICKADTIGVFQIESRAQMTMLPRLKPKCFYDLVIEVAIVRPGPIIGDMVHPYLRRRNGEEPITYPDSKVEKVLGKTLGIPLFQEQAMSLAIVAAGFTPGEAEKLRRTISAWKTRGKDTIPLYQERFIQGMMKNGYEKAFAEQCFNRLKGFSEYGFPESHSASFALIVYASAWLKRHYPAVFAAALLNSQPMGFYAPAQIVRDARDHGVKVRGIDVQHSDWDCTLEDSGETLRLGFRLVKGLREADARAIVEAKKNKSVASIVDLWRASGIAATALRTFAQADAFRSLGLDRQQALWSVQSLKGKALPLFDGAWRETETQSDLAPLPLIPLPTEVAKDYYSTGLSLKAHPMSFLRDTLKKKGTLTAAEIRDESCCPHGKRAAVAGLVLFRQMPSTAKNVLFMTLEDETGRSDLIVRPHIVDRYRSAANFSKILIARGRVERQGLVVHILVQELKEISYHAGTLPTLSRDFR